ncbi:hypothetical protein EPI10_021078 [Gossypium australe]|uniref:Uncharacterized protein n=1 Tax=Gossypium australe TaxID=47621 RepID=A0A5B6WFM7_9ROSI|nr:hypothetical protein EPI10_021078 [Gossypium australe]
MEDLLKEYIAKNDVIIQRALPSDTKNSRSQKKEQCKVITHRIGMQLPGVVNDTTIEERSSYFTNKKNSEPVVEQAAKEKSNQKNVERDSSCITNKNATTKQHQQIEGRPPPPFPQRFQKSKQDFQFKKFLDVLKQLHINIPLVEALEQILNYVKFMKDILSKKRRLEESKNVALLKRA